MHGIDENFQRWTISPMKKILNCSKVKDFLHVGNIFGNRVNNFHSEWAIVNLGGKVSHLSNSAHLMTYACRFNEHWGLFLIHYGHMIYTYWKFICSYFRDVTLELRTNPVFHNVLANLIDLVGDSIRRWTCLCSREAVDSWVPSYFTVV